MIETVFVVEQLKENYTVLDNTCLRDNSLSWKAKGVHSYLFSLPRDWKIHTTEIAKHSRDGYEALKSAIKELIAHGYISRSRERDDKGQFTCLKYTVRMKPHSPSVDNPSVDNPSVDNPSVDNPSVDNPSVDNPSTSNPYMDNPSVEIPADGNHSPTNY